jgi:site-specific DNA-methyltransferase (adenine-specific)
MKPVQLLKTLIKHGSQENAIVYDSFGGSGSTLIACEQTNRICYMMEIDPNYCSVIIERWENLTGKKATKLTK